MIEKKERKNKFAWEWMFTWLSATIFLLELDSVSGVLLKIILVFLGVVFAFWPRGGVNYPVRCAQHREKLEVNLFLEANHRAVLFCELQMFGSTFFVFQQLTYN